MNSLINNNRFKNQVVAFSLIGTMLVRKFTIRTFLSFKPVITDLGLILVVGGLGYFVKPKINPTKFPYVISV